MSDDESRERLILCAKKEFAEKGFAKASLRKIAADAGLTTGAVYFFFKDKNGLFGAVAKEAMDGFFALLSDHLRNEEKDGIPHDGFVRGYENDFARDLVTFLYDHYDTVMILFHKAAGSQYEDLVDRIADELDRSYLIQAEEYASRFEGKKVNRYLLHFHTHMQIEAFTHLLEHVPDKETAYKEIRPVMDMLISSWMEYVLEDDN